MAGPLAGLKALEFAGIGPGPFCGMLLSDLGADVVRIDRKEGRQERVGTSGRFAITQRGRRSIALDLRRPEAVEVCLKLAERSDLLFEGYRPGVMERLGLGPETVLARNPALVFGRMTGWGQTGPYSNLAGHDINYLAITGALGAIGTDEKPVPPLNLVGDFGGGALYLAFGLLAGLVHARSTGHGQVIDCAISDGTTSLMAMIYGLRAMGTWDDSRRSNILDGGAHFYDTYRCSDGRWISIGAIEPRFYSLLLEKMGIVDPAFNTQFDRSAWPALHDQLAAAFALKTQAEWCTLMDGYDVCFAPVVNMNEAPAHPHNVARQSFVEVDGVAQPAPAPRFSLTPGAIRCPPPAIGANNEEVLREWGVEDSEITELVRVGAM